MAGSRVSRSPRSIVGAPPFDEVLAERRAQASRRLLSYWLRYDLRLRDLAIEVKRKRSDEQWLHACHRAATGWLGGWGAAPTTDEQWRGFVLYLQRATEQRLALDSLHRVSPLAAAHEARSMFEAWWATLASARLVRAVQRRQRVREKRITRGHPRPPDALYVQEGAPPPVHKSSRK